MAAMDALLLTLLSGQNASANSNEMDIDTFLSPGSHDHNATDFAGAAGGAANLTNVFLSTINGGTDVAFDGFYEAVPFIDSPFRGLHEYVQAIGKVTTPCISVLGTAGNMLAVIVFLRTPTLCKQTSSYYLTALCMSDTVVLLLFALGYLSSNNYIDFYHRSVACELTNYLSGVFSCFSVWLVVAFTAERYIAVWHPLRRPTWCTAKRAKITMLAFFIMCLVANSPLVYFSDLVQRLAHLGTVVVSPRLVCELREQKKGSMWWYNNLDIMLALIFPSVVIAVLNICMWIRLRARKQHGPTPPEQCDLERGGSSERRNDSPAERASLNILRLHPFRDPMRATRMARSANKVTNMLLIVSTAFVCLNCPSYLLRFYMWHDADQDFAKSPGWQVLQYLTTFLYQISFAMNFFLYCMSGQNFRTATMNLFVRRKLSWRRRTEFSGETVSHYIRRSLQSVRRRHRTSSNTSNVQQVAAATLAVAALPLPTIVSNTTTTITQTRTQTTTLTILNETAVGRGAATRNCAVKTVPVLDV